tara:strand:- start:1122 stop:1589 length:468 start_codon:yes stop_codon:yes gene_type:complete
MNKLYCFRCGENVIWGGDHTYEDHGMDGDGIVSNLACNECGAEYLMMTTDHDEESRELVRKKRMDSIKGMYDEQLKLMTQDAVALLMQLESLSHTLECTYGNLDQSEEWTRLLCNIRTFLTQGKEVPVEVEMIFEIARKRREQEQKEYESNQEEE